MNRRQVRSVVDRVVEHMVTLAVDAALGEVDRQQGGIAAYLAKEARYTGISAGTNSSHIDALCDSRRGLGKRNAGGANALIGCDVVLLHDTCNAEQEFRAGSRAVVSGSVGSVFHLDFVADQDGKPMTGHLRMVGRDMFKRVPGAKP